MKKRERADINGKGNDEKIYKNDMIKTAIYAVFYGGEGIFLPPIICMFFLY
jgi:hypothetical protein